MIEVEAEYEGDEDEYSILNSSEIFRTFRELQSPCPINKRINRGEFNHLFKQIEEDKNLFDSVFFKLCNDLFNKKNMSIKVSNFVTIDKIISISTNNYKYIFFNSETHDAIDYKYNLSKTSKEKVHDIHYLTAYKLINHIYKNVFNKILSERFMNFDTLNYYINIIDFIIHRKDIAQKIVDKYLSDLKLENDFELFLMKFDIKVDSL